MTSKTDDILRPPLFLGDQVLYKGEELGEVDKIDFTREFPYWVVFRNSGCGWFKRNELVPTRRS
jgi:hypothetical protein